MKYKLKITVSIAIGGDIIIPGRVVEVDKALAEDLLRRGKAELVQEPDDEPAPEGWVPARLDRAGLAKFPKAELLRIAREMQIDVPESTTKAELIELLAAEDILVPPAGDAGEPAGAA